MTEDQKPKSGGLVVRPTSQIAKALVSSEEIAKSLEKYAAVSDQSVSEADQKYARAGGDNVGRDKTTKVTTIERFEYYPPPPTKLGVVETLLRKLEAEIDANASTRDTLDTLLQQYKKQSPDGIVGLQAKLEKSGRGAEYVDAARKKELFQKQLEKWGLFGSAQKIFLYLLTKVEHEFNYHIYPDLMNLTEVQANQRVTDAIVNPIAEECGPTRLGLNHSEALGMLYWLAEQCYVRWHHDPA